MTADEEIKVIDADGDGRLAAEEHAAGSGRMLERMDTNKDGSPRKAGRPQGEGGRLSEDWPNA